MIKEVWLLMAKRNNKNKGDVELRNKKKQSENCHIYDCNLYIVCSISAVKEVEF